MECLLRKVKMATIRLAPRTKRGKQLLAKHGPVWDLMYKSDYCIAFHGPGYFIRSIVDERESRWIRLGGGPDFHIVKMTGEKSV